MVQQLPDPGFVRSHLHFIAHALTDFIEMVNSAEPDAEMVEQYGRKGRYAGHSNINAITHNIEVLFALDLLVPLKWPENQGVEPEAFHALRQEVDTVLTRWSWGVIINGWEGEKNFSLDPNAPASKFTTAEAARLSRALRGLEWYLFCLPRDEENPEVHVDSIAPHNDLDAYIYSLGSPIFFRTRRFLDTESVDQLGKVIKELKDSPEAMAVVQAHTFRQSFRIGQSGCLPEKARLLDILAKAEMFLIAVETCLPIEGDEERGERSFGTSWRDAEYYVCEAASALCDVVDGEEGENGDSSLAFAHGWNTEINFGLRCLESQLGTLLAGWGVATWEQRIVHGKDTEKSTVTIRPEALAGLRRSIETIRSGIDQAGLGRAEETEKIEARKKRQKTEVGKRWKIIEVYHDHKDWSYAQIATAAGADRGHVCRVVKPLRDAERMQFKASMARGFKAKDGTLDAWSG